MSAENDARAYVEKHNLNKVFEDLLQQLVVNKPGDPVEFLISYLRRPKGRKLVLVGPQGAGKTTQSKQIEKFYGCSVLRVPDVIAAAAKSSDATAQQAQEFVSRPEQAPDSLVVQLIRNATNDPKVQEKGWVLVDYPRTRAQAVALQAAGVIPDRALFLSAKDATLRSRVGSQNEQSASGAWAYYAKHELLLREAFSCAAVVNANSEAEDVFQRIRDAVEDS
eukprot:TRINITY_DN10237_c0_g4_i1.p1 TRINITY_DN10237_c0_g4~~TRINITY_DN10237_c0_g4_i1.p1  ORF type:complete len:222 (-),score=62.06 TRINITY_DN10237_c0_g4_i1:624-1289(-)